MKVKAGISVIGPGSPSPGWMTRVGFQNHHSMGISPSRARSEARAARRVPEHRDEERPRARRSRPQHDAGSWKRVPEPPEERRRAVSAKIVENRQVVRHVRRHRRQVDQRRHQHEAVVVVVDEPAGEPRVVRRERRRLDDRVQVREVHRLLAARTRARGPGSTSGRRGSAQRASRTRPSPTTSRRQCSRTHADSSWRCATAIATAPAVTIATAVQIAVRVNGIIRRLEIHQTTQVTSRGPTTRPIA